MQIAEAQRSRSNAGEPGIAEHRLHVAKVEAAMMAQMRHQAAGHYPATAAAVLKRGAARSFAATVK